MGLSTVHFSDKELSCPCCGVNNMDEAFMKRIEEIREIFEEAMVITSAYRCPIHNSQVSKTGPTGPHTTGHAIDIAISGAEAFRLLDVALQKGITGIGISQRGEMNSRFLHLDDLPGTSEIPRPRVWSY